MGGSSTDIQIKQKKEQRKFRKKNQIKFGHLVQPWTVDVLSLNWSAQSQDLCWEDKTSSDQREEWQELQPRNHAAHEQSLADVPQNKCSQKFNKFHRKHLCWSLILIKSQTPSSDIK